MKKKLIPAVSLCAALVSGAAASNAMPQRNFGYGPMEIYKINNGTHQLKAEDLDSDGLDDIIFLNNEKSRIEVLFRKKKTSVDGTELLEDSFQNSGMMSDQMVSMYRLADLNHDKKTDILTLGRPLGLYIRYQQANRKFSSAKHIFLNNIQSITTVQTGDINGDGLDDIVIARRQSAEILWNDKQHSFMKRKTVLFSDDKCFWVKLVDANNDGHLDLLQYYYSKNIPMKVRLGDGKGNFGPSNMLRAAKMGSSTIIDPDQGSPLMIAAIMANNLGMRIYGFNTSKQPELLKTQEFTPQRLAIPGKGSVSSRPWLTTDFNADGFDDLLLAAPAKSRLYLYSGDATGLKSSAQKYDSLAEVSGLTLLADNDIMAVSRKEKTVGIHRSHNMAKFPDLLNLKGELITAGAISATKSIFVIRRTDNGMALDCYDDLKFKRSLPLKLDNEPSTIIPLTMDNKTTGIIMFIDYSPPKMILVKDDSDKIENINSTQFRALSKNLKPKQITAETPGSGQALIVADGTTVRRYAWSNGTYRITSQFNPMNEHAQANLACLVSHAKNRSLIVYDSNSKDLLWYTLDNPGDPRKIHITGTSANFEGIVQLKNKKRSVLLMINNSDVAVLADNTSIISLKQLGEYTTHAEKPSLRMVRSIKVGHGQPALAIIDAANRAIEIVANNKSGIKNILTFAAFLKSDMVGPATAHSTEPHDITSGDINGDGLSDMILLTHDKLIIYPGE